MADDGLPSVRERESSLGLVVDSVRRLGREFLDDGKIEATGTIDAALRHRLADAGLFGLALPEEHGGLGFGLEQTAQVVAVLAEHDRSVATMVGLHNGLGTQALVAHGEPDTRARWLPLLAEGRAIAAFAATEPGAGSDLTAIRTALTERDGALRLDGNKAYVTNGGFASVVTVLARSPGGSRGHTLVLVPTSARGVRIGPEEDKLGLRASSTTSLFFDDVELRRTDVLGEIGDGLSRAHDVLVWGRTLLASGCVGTARRALALALEHVTMRRQFGRTLSGFHATREHLAIMAARVAAARGLVQRSGRAVDALHSGDASFTSAVTKIFASEAAFDVCDRAIQLHGASGFIEGSGLPRLLRDCRVTRIFEGANDVLISRVALAWLAGVSRHELASLLDEPARAAIDRTCAALGGGVAIAKEQVVLARLGRALVWHAAASALRAATDVEPAVARYGARRFAMDGDAELSSVEHAADDERGCKDVLDALLDAPNSHDKRGRAA